MNENKSLGDVIDTFFKEGDDCDYGCLPKDVEKMWEVAVNKSNSSKNIYAVKLWTWFDIEIEGEKLEIVKADYVIDTNNRRFDVGDWVRTSPIINLEYNCICETVSSYYILVGKGTRKNSDESIFSFFG